MGFLDDAMGAIDRGTAAVGRTTKSAQLKMQLADLKKRRRDLSAQLGASLYEVTKSDAALRAGREELYDAIERLDRQCADLDVQIRSLDVSASPQSQPTHSISCPKCGMAILEDDLFCSGCGMVAEEARTAAIPATLTSTIASSTDDGLESRKCPRCSATVNEGDGFCMNCGASLEPTND